MYLSKQVTFLLVEDDEVDVMMMKRTFKELKIENPIVVARNGLEALQKLRGKDGQEGLGKPYIILLDLNMPVMSGLEFLEALRSDPMLRTAVVFVLTTSKDDRDRVSAYEQNVAGYIVKSDPASGCFDAISMIDEYWRVVELP